MKIRVKPMSNTLIYIFLNLGKTYFGIIFDNTYTSLIGHKKLNNIERDLKT